MKKNKIIFSLSLPIISVCITLLLLELIFRIGDIRGEYMQPRQDVMFDPPILADVPYKFKPQGTLRSIYPSNPRGYFKEDNFIDHKVNSIGWRDKEHSFFKPLNTYRILGLGDSYLYGQGVFYDDICLSKLESSLNRSNNFSKKIETINRGRGGVNTADERDLLIVSGLSYHPDLVIVHFVLNDVEQDVFKQEPKVEFFMDYLSIFMESDDISNYSYLWSWTRQRYLKHINGNAYIQQCLESYLNDTSKSAFVKNALSDIKTICKENNARLLVVIFPFYYQLNGDYPFRPIHDHVKSYCDKESIPVLDLLPFYKNFNGPELWVHPVDQHPNEIAHDIAAKAIYGFLMKNKSYFGLS